MKILGKTLHGGAEAEVGLAAPEKIEVHFRSDIFIQNFRHKHKSYEIDIHQLKIKEDYLIQPSFISF